MALAQSYLAGMSDPFAGVFNSFAQGAEFRRYKDQSELLRAQQEREMQMYDELDQLDFTDDDQLRQFVGRYGERAAAVKEQLNALDAQQQQAYVSDISRANALLKNGKTESAVEYARTRAEAYANAGDGQKAQEYAEMADFIEANPQAAQQQLAMTYALMTPKDAADAYSKYAETHIAQNKAPFEIAKTRAETDKIEAEEVKTYADAKDIISQTNERDTLLPHQQANIDADTGLKTAQGNKAQTEADLAPQELALEQEKVRLDNQIKQLELQLQSEKNETERKKIEVEISKLENQQAQYAAGLTKEQVERNQKNQERLASYQSEKENISTTKETVKRLLNNSKGLQKAVGPLDRWTPTFLAKTKEFERDLETLQSQVFLSQVSQMKGLGALTEMEGAKLESSIANLSLDMDEATMKRNLALIYDYMNRAEKRLETKYQDLVQETAQNDTGTIAGRSYMAILN